MPGPSTIVTFTDADGDEFPIRIYGHWGEEDPMTEDWARKVLGQFIENGDFKPTMPVRVAKVEEV